MYKTLSLSLIALITLGLNSKVVSDNSKGLLIKISLKDAEHSQDSNSTTEELVIHGHKVNYSWRYGGYHPDENFVRKKSFKTVLNKKQIAEVLRRISIKKLHRNVTEKMQTSHGRSIDLTCTIFHQGKQTTTIIKGMTQVWNKRSEKMISETAYVAGIRDLIEYVKTLLKK